jgi:hypothetical protein
MTGLTYQVVKIFSKISDHQQSVVSALFRCLPHTPVLLVVADSSTKFAKFPP